MPVPAMPGAGLAVIQAETVFRAQEAFLDGPAQPASAGEFGQIGARGGIVSRDMENCPHGDTRNCPPSLSLRRAEMNEARITESPSWDDPRGQEMKTPDDVVAMVRLKACGWGIKRIARALGCSHHTVKHYVAAGGPGAGQGAAAREEARRARGLAA